MLRIPPSIVILAKWHISIRPSNLNSSSSEEFENLNLTSNNRQPVYCTGTVQYSLSSCPCWNDFLTSPPENLMATPAIVLSLLEWLSDIPGTSYGDPGNKVKLSEKRKARANLIKGIFGKPGNLLSKQSAVMFLERLSGIPEQSYERQSLIFWKARQTRQPASSMPCVMSVERLSDIPEKSHCEPVNKVK